MKDDSVFLTYDDGPFGDNTRDILDVLERANVKATFFMLGKAMEESPDIVKRVIENGHTLGYHSYRHVSLKKRKFREVRQDVRELNRLSKLFDYPIRFYRPPYGDLTLTAILWFILNGKKIIMWSLDSRDSFDDFEQVVKNISPDAVSNGEVILFHDDYNQAAELLETTLKAYAENKVLCKPL